MDGEIMFIGLIIVVICIGVLFSAIYGWLVLGVGLIAYGFIEYIISDRSKKKKKG